MLGVIPLQQQDLALPLVELHEIHLCPILQPIKTPLNGSTPILCISHLASSVNLLRVQPVPSSKSLIKTLNSICPSIDPWDTLVVSGLQLGFVQLIPTFELGSSASFQPISLLIHLTLTSSVCLWRCYGRQCEKPCPSSTVLPFPTPNHYIIGSRHGQARFPLHKSLRTTPNHLLVLMFWNGFQDYLLHLLSWDRGDGYQPVVLWIFLLALLEDSSDICFLSGNSSAHHDLPKIIKTGLMVTSASSLGTYGGTPASSDSESILFPSYLFLVPPRTFLFHVWV